MELLVKISSKRFSINRRSIIGHFYLLPFFSAFLLAASCSGGHIAPEQIKNPEVKAQVQAAATGPARDLLESSAFLRTFWIMYGKSTGTGFVVDVDGKQYFVSARHIFGGNVTADLEINFRVDERWQPVKAHLVGTGAGDTDVIVFALETVLFRGPPIAINDEFYISQDVFFLGYPHGLSTRPLPNNHFPMPLVKKATVSGYVVDNASKEPAAMLLDGINNPGFSGGPILSIQDGKLSVIGVTVSHLLSNEEVTSVDDSDAVRPVAKRLAFKKSSNEVVAYSVDKLIPKGFSQLKSTSRLDTGIVIGFYIKYVLMLIRANPVGVPLS